MVVLVFSALTILVPAQAVQVESQDSVQLQQAQQAQESEASDSNPTTRWVGRAFFWAMAD